MRIFSRHRKKMDPRRRFGGLEFRNKIKNASNYKRVFNPANFGSAFKVFPGFGRFSRLSWFAGIIIFVVAFYYLVISPKFVVTDITVQDNHQVTTEQIQQVIEQFGESRLFLVKKNNFFLMSSGRVNSLLTSKIPTIKEIVKFDRTWPNKIRFNVVERTPGFVIHSNDAYFLVDDEGVVISQIEDKKNLLVAENQVVENFSQGEILPNQKLAPFILSMSRQWPAKLKIGIESVKFPGKTSLDVQFVTTLGFGVMFDTTRSVTIQLSNLAVILSKQISAKDQARLAYIDLRLSKWVYYCFKASPCHQEEQPDQAGANTESSQP